MNLPSRNISLRVVSDGLATTPAGVGPQQLDQVLTRARQLGVPLHNDPQVAGILASLRLDTQVPPTLYAAAASVLASVYDACAAVPVSPPSPARLPLDP